MVGENKNVIYKEVCKILPPSILDKSFVHFITITIYFMLKWKVPFDRCIQSV